MDAIAMAKGFRGQAVKTATVCRLEPASVPVPEYMLEVPKAPVTRDICRAAGVKPMASTGGRSTTDRSKTVFVDGGFTRTPTPDPKPNNFCDLVARIKAGEHAGMEQLYRLFNGGVRYYFCRHLGGQDLDDKIHDTFLIVVKAIQNEALREPDRLMGFVGTVARRQVAAYIENAIHTRRDQTDIEHGATISDTHQDPEREAIALEETGLINIALESLSPKDREILVRFYLKEELPKQICREMSLTATQFRLRKSRAKEKFGVTGRKNLAGVNIDGIIALPRAS